MSFRAVAVAGNWDSVSASAIQQAPLVKQQYPFSIFETQGQQQWVMMPAWSAVMVAAEPVALVIDDCAKLDVLMKQLQVPTATELVQASCTVRRETQVVFYSATKLLRRCNLCLVEYRPQIDCWVAQALHTFTVVKSCTH